MRKLSGLMIVFLILTSQIFAHSGKPKYHVIIDTDGAIDDMRSISMFLSGNDIRVLAITCSQGTLLPDSVYGKVNTLLSSFHHEGIPVGVGGKTEKKLPVWSSFDRNIPWGESLDVINKDLKACNKEILNKVTEDYPDKLTLIALGSLKTYADWFRSDPKTIEKIDRIIWYNNAETENGFNYQASTESFNFIKSKGVKFEIVVNNSDKLFINEVYLNSLKNTNSVYADQIIKVHKEPEIVEQIRQKQLQFRNDIVPLYLAVPILFETENKDSVSIVSLNNAIPDSLIYELVGKLLESASTANNRVFNMFPVESSLYKPEYAKILNPTIEKYGLVEWKAISLTNEIHGHTGIYSIIGAKMGVRAMEYFNVGVNNLRVTTFCGYEPPLSCFNDGIQISTGATIGQGLITVSDSISAIPTVIFEFNKQKLKISLKPDISTQIQEDIKYGIQTRSMLTEKYWLYIENIAIRYWSELSRFDIFNISEIQ